METGGEFLDDVQLQNNLDDDMVQEVLKTGTDLRQYSRQIEKELKEVENKSIKDYIKESQNIASLHNQIAACDNILERMESMLLSFQSDLGSISSEILYLQRKSVSMSQQLTNRQAVKGQLSQFIDDIAVSNALISGILNAPVTEKRFLTHLEVLNHKIKFVKEQSFKETKSCCDVKEMLEKLKIKAVTKIRAHLLEHISKFRKPMTNYQVTQNNMLKYKFFYEFALANERCVAQEVCAEYVDTMSKIYYSYFKTYSSRLAKLRYEEQATKDDLMGIEDMGALRNVGLFYKTPLKHKSTVFTIGNRGDVLSAQLEAPAIVPHVAAQKTENRYPFEALFRSEQYMLVDNACREYLFVAEFFIVQGDAALDLFNRILGKTLNLLVKNLETFVQDCYDAIALFLCVHLILRYQLMCHKRAVPALDQYWDTLQEIIWPSIIFPCDDLPSDLPLHNELAPAAYDLFCRISYNLKQLFNNMLCSMITRFEYIFKLNIQSIKESDPPTKFSKEMGPHYITRRYAEFSAALVGISESFPSELVNRLLAQLQDEVECFILRMAAIFPQRKEQLIFLINNYDMVLSILMERTRDNSTEAECFRKLLNNCSDEYVKEILSPHFGGMLQFIKEGEALVEKGQAEELKHQEKKALALVQSFSAEWKRSLEELNREVLSSFPSLVTGSSLLQLALTQLVQYYHRFHKLLSPNARSQLTNIHHIMVELKKYKTNF